MQNVVKTIKSTSIHFMTIDGAHEMAVSGIVDVNAARRHVSKKLGHKNFIVTDCISRGETYTMPLDRFMSFARPIERFRDGAWLVKRSSYVTDVQYKAINGDGISDYETTLEGRFTDSALRTAIRRIVGSNNFMIVSSREHESTVAIPVPEFMELCATVVE